MVLEDKVLKLRMSRLFLIFSKGINQPVASFLANKVLENLPVNFEKKETQWSYSQRRKQTIIVKSDQLEHPITLV